MVGSRTATAVAGVALSLAISAAVWWLFDVAFLLFLVPFVPILFSKRWGEDAPDPTVRECPTCGFRTADPGFDYCPRDGARLDREGDEHPPTEESARR